MFLKHAVVAELADALDLGSSVNDVKVQVLSTAPRLGFAENRELRRTKDMANLFFVLLFVINIKRRQTYARDGKNTKRYNFTNGKL